MELYPTRRCAYRLWLPDLAERCECWQCKITPKGKRQWHITSVGVRNLAVRAIASAQ